MKNYAVLEGMKRHQKTILDDAFNKGYEQGYQDGKLDGEAENIEKLEKQLDDEKKAEYKRGYADGKKEVAAELNFEKGYYKGYEDGKNDIVSKAKAEVSQYREGYDKGLKHGQELRIEEAECAEACGMKRAWQAVRKIMYMSLFDLDELFPGWDVEHIIEKLSAKEVIEKVEAWEKKQEQNKASCKNCDHGSVKPGKYYDCQILSCDAVPCVIVDGHCDKYEEKQEQTEKSCDTCKHNNVASGIDGTCYECVKGVQDNYEEKTEKTCENCKYNNREKTSYPCAACLRKIDGRHAMWEAKEDYMRDATPEESKSVNDYIKSISKETGVTFNEKEEQTEKSCKTCKSNPPEKKWPCVDCDVSIHDRYEPKQEHSNIDPAPPLVNCKDCVKYQSTCNGVFGDMESHCTAFEEKLDATKNDVKVGDNVRITKDTDCANMKLFPIGTFGIVTDITIGANFPYKISANGKSWRYSRDMFEVVKNDVSKMKSEKPEEGGE